MARKYLPDEKDIMILNLLQYLQSNFPLSIDDAEELSFMFYPEIINFLAEKEKTNITVGKKQLSKI